MALHTGEEQEYETTPYARYWHGYLVLLKPMLLFFTYQRIRCFLALLQFGLAAAVIYLLAVRGKGLYCLPVLLAYYFLDPAACSLSMQYTPVLVLTMVQLVVILLREERYAVDKGLWFYHFFLVGCLIAYLDLLTYPVVTLGIPVIFLLSQYEESWKEGVKEFIGCCLLWGTGYLTMWAGKWTLGSLITGEKVWQEAVYSIAYRSGHGITGARRLGVIALNLSKNQFTLILVFIAFVACLVVSVYRGTLRFRGGSVPVALGGMLPFGWYLVASNHSMMHSWMTFRTLAVFVFAVATIGVMLLDGPEAEKARVEKGKKRKRLS